VIHILPTESTPEVHFSQDGIIKIRGRAVTVYKTEFLEQMMKCIDVYLKNPAEITYVDIAFEYLNSYGTIVFTKVLKELSKVNLQSKKLIIQWYYEEEDVDILECGQSISSKINVPIKFILTKRIADIK
jgi:hypothetical protein